MNQKGRFRVERALITLIEEFEYEIKDLPILDGRISITEEMSHDIRRMMMLVTCLFTDKPITITDFVNQYTRVTPPTVFNMMNHQNTRVNHRKLLMLLEDFKKYQESRAV